MKRGPLLFFPSRANAKGRIPNVRREQDFFEAIRRLHPSVFVARSVAQLADSPAPGVETFFAPDYPELCDRLIRSASGVIACAIEDVESALNLNVPALLLSDDTFGLSLRETPALSWAGRSIPVLAEECQKILHSIPTERISHLAEQPTTEYSVCLISDEQYLPFLVGILDNLQNLPCAPRHVHLLALDESSRAWISHEPRFGGYSIYSLSDLWNQRELQLLQGRPISQIAYSSKPKLLERAILEKDHSAFYFDLDLFFFSSPAHLANEFRDKSVLLFPQWNDYLPASKIYGVYNAGMVGVRRGAEPFLQWWAELCLNCYESDPNLGYYVDQGFLDLAYNCFDSIGVYRAGDHNRAAWNECTLSDLDSPIRSFHGAVRDRWKRFEYKLLWDQVCALATADPTVVQSSVLRTLCLEQHGQHWLNLSRLLFVQKLFRRDRSWGLAWLGSWWFQIALGLAATCFHPFRGFRARIPFWKPASDRFASPPNRAWIDIQRQRVEPEASANLDPYKNTYIQ